VSVVALDTETFLMGPAAQVPRMVCVSYASDHDNSYGLLHHTDPRALDFVRGSLEEDAVVFANPSFDLLVFLRWQPRLWDPICRALEEGRIKDVQVRQKLFDVVAEGKLSKSYSLKTLANLYRMGELDKDTWRLCYHRLYHNPLDQWPQGAVEYAVKDAQTTLAIYQQQAKLEPDENEGDPVIDIFSDEGFQNRSAFALNLCSAWGLRVKSERFNRLAHQLDSKRDSLREILTRYGIIRDDLTRDISRAKAYVRSVYSKKQIPLGKVPTTPTGDISLSEEALETISDDPVIEAYLAYAKTNSFISKDLASLRKGIDAPIHTRFDTFRETGRVSSYSPNLQNLPRRPYEIRECITAREGHAFAVVDYTAGELYALAQVCITLGIESRLAEILNAGRDPHLEVGLDLLDNPCSYEEGTRWKAGHNGEVWKARILEARQLAKICNFGWPGGMGPARFTEHAKGYGVDISLNRSHELREGWLDALPEMPLYFADVRSKCVDREKGHYRMQDRPGGRWRTCTSYPSACNYRFQALMSNGAKEALWRIAKAQLEHGSVLSGTATVGFYHDEIVVEVPIDRGHECVNAMSKIMVDSYNVFVPDVPSRVEGHLTSCLSKRAEAVFSTTPDGSSKLDVWHPPS